MRVVVTGAAGFIGSHVSESLVAGGHRVVGVDDFSGRYAGGWRGANLDRLAWRSEFSFEQADLSRMPAPGPLQGADAVLHLAGRPGVRGDDPAAYRSRNVVATECVLRAAEAAGVRRLVLASSSSVYAPGSGPTPEDASLAPISHYGRSKLEAERICAASALETVVVRLFTVYGPRQRPGMAFARFVNAARSGRPAPLLGDGTQARDFTYVSDAARGLLAALGRGRPGGVYNVSGGRVVTLAEARHRLSRIAGRPVPCESHAAHGAEPRRTEADLARARADLGYRPEVALEQGLALQLAAATATGRAHRSRHAGPERARPAPAQG